MASVVRIANLSRPGYYMKMGKALRAIEACACVWVEEGVSVRDLTLEESLAARNKQAQKRRLSRTVLGVRAELPGISFVPPTSTQYRAPYRAYEQMSEPIGVRYCRWPRPEFFEEAVSA